MRVLFLTQVLPYPLDAGPRLRARVLHADAAGMKRRAAMGFEQGWGKALDQMLAYIRTA